MGTKDGLIQSLAAVLAIACTACVAQGQPDNILLSLDVVSNRSQDREAADPVQIPTGSEHEWLTVPRIAAKVEPPNPKPGESFTVSGVFEGSESKFPRTVELLILEFSGDSTDIHDFQSIATASVVGASFRIQGLISQTFGKTDSKRPLNLKEFTYGLRVRSLGTYQELPVWEVPLEL